MEVGSSTLPGTTVLGGLAQLARAPALQAGGQRFESVILHFGLFARPFYDMLHEDRQRELPHGKRRNEGRMADALALGGDEGRDKLRKSARRCK